MKKPGKPANEIERLKEFILPPRSKLVEILRFLHLNQYKIQHSIDVADLAVKIAEEIARVEGIKPNISIVEAGALLHDIGLSAAFDDLSPEHGVIGADLIRKIGLPENVAKCAEVHEMFGGLTRKVAEELKFPIRPFEDDYFPKTLEQEIVVAADLFQYMLKEATEEFGFKKYDPWQRPEESKEASFSYLSAVYKKKIGKVPTRDSFAPLLEKAYEICTEYVKYVKPEFIRTNNKKPVK